MLHDSPTLPSVHYVMDSPFDNLLHIRSLSHCGPLALSVALLTAQTSSFIGHDYFVSIP